MTSTNATSRRDSDQAPSIRRHEPVVNLGPVTLPSVFEAPQFLLDGHCCQHVPFQFWVVEAARPRSILSFGQRSAEAYFAFCQMIEQLALECRCSWIIESDGNEEATDFEKTVGDWKSKSTSSFDSFAQISVCKPGTALAQVREESVDVIHIDVNNVLGDIENMVDQAIKLLSRRGILLLQGSRQTNECPGLSEIVSSMSEAYPCFEFPHGTGLLAIGVGDSPPILLEWLFEQSSELIHQSTVQAMFCRIGEGHKSLLLLEEINKQASDLVEIRKEIEQIRASVSDTLLMTDNCPTTK